RCPNQGARRRSPRPRPPGSARARLRSPSPREQGTLGEDALRLRRPRHAPRHDPPRGKEAAVEARSAETNRGELALETRAPPRRVRGGARALGWRLAGRVYRPKPRKNERSFRPRLK